MFGKKEASQQEIEDLVKMIDGKMDGGVSRLSVSIVDHQEKDYVIEKRSYGKRDAWDPWVWGEGYKSRGLEESF